MLNNVSVIGRWTKNPELRYTPQGKGVASGTLAVQRSFKNAQGEYDADFINVVIWGDKIAELIANKCEKGGRFGGTGRIQSRSFEGQDGKRVYITEVVIEKVTMIDWAEGGQGGQSRQNEYSGGRSGGNAPSDDPFAGGGQIELSDDDLPF